MSLLDQVNTAPGFWCVAIDFMNLPGLPKAICLFLKLIIIGVQLLYNVVLVSAVQQKVNQLHVYIYPLFKSNLLLFSRANHILSQFCLRVS